MKDRDRAFMRRALQLAEQGWGRVAPNPMVGAVVVKDGDVVGEGYHAEWGAPHAEVVALAAAGEEARGATLYVNLEPCHHSGKTGPCSRVVRDAGVARVICGVADNNPDAAGGASWMREQGVEVEVGLCEREARDLNAIHLSAAERTRPFVALKYAMSLDARLAERPGGPTRVTQGEAIVEAHRLRAGHAAVMVGSGTARADDPLLTVREWRAPRQPPLRVVLDSDLRLPDDARLLRSAEEGSVRVFGAVDASEERAAALRDGGVEVTRVPRTGEGLDLKEVLRALYEDQVDSVMCEGGGRLGSALLAGGLVDRMYLFVAPLLLGEAGVPGFQGDLAVVRDWRLIQSKPVGDATFLSLAPGQAP